MMMRILTATMLAATLIDPAGHAAGLEFAGVNLAGAEFGEGSLPGNYGQHYIYPNQSEVDYFKSRGMNVVRLCFRWERLQQSLNTNLDATELSRLHGFVSPTTAKGVHVVLDPHNYARYYGNIVGSGSVPISAFSNFWWRVADIYRTNDHVIFGLMNEPHDMVTETWRDAAQAAINAIRAAGAGNLILVPGNGWDGAHSWLQNWYGTPNGTAMLAITDPGDNFAFEAHQYLDSDSSGTSATIVSSTIGAERLMAFTEWCRSNNRRGFLGEFAVANSTIGAGIGDEAISNMLAYVEQNADVWLGWTWWAAGPWWGNYMFSLEPTSNYTVDQPAMGVLKNFFPIPVPHLLLVNGNQFQFDTWPGFQFQAEVSAEQAGGIWTNYGSEISGTGFPATVTMTVNEPGAAYFRVRGYRAP